VTTKF